MADNFMILIPYEGVRQESVTHQHTAHHFHHKITLQFILSGFSLVVGAL